MSEDLHRTIAELKPFADAVVDAATALNGAIQAAARQGLTVRIEVLDENTAANPEAAPMVRVRISKQIV
jgi:hypothetical protein